MLTAGLRVFLCPQCMCVPARTLDGVMYVHVLHLRTDWVKGMFSAVDFSASGSTRRELEEQAYVYFGDYLDALEGMYMYVHILHDMTLYIISFTLTAQQIDSCTLGEVLIFFSGADYPPPLGFLKKAQLKFLECEKGRVSSSYCIHILFNIVPANCTPVFR